MHIMPHMKILCWYFFKADKCQIVVIIFVACSGYVSNKSYNMRSNDVFMRTSIKQCRDKQTIS